MLEPVVRPQRAQERLLPASSARSRAAGADSRAPRRGARRRSARTAESAPSQPPSSWKRGRVPSCEMRGRRSCRVGRVRPGAAHARSRVKSRTAARLAGTAGGGAVMARQIARLNGACEFFTALGDDELGRRSERRLAELGVDVHAVRFGESRRGWVHIDDAGERTITRLGAEAPPRGPLPLKGYDAVFFVSGDGRGAAIGSGRPLSRGDCPRAGDTPGSRRQARLAHRQRERSGRAVRRRRSRPQPSSDRGRRGGTANGVPYQAASLPGPVVDAYGAGDSFGATLCFALARGDDLRRRARPCNTRGRRGRDRGGPLHGSASVTE